jgi:polyhydroxybutyrate depolymerase
VSRSPSGGLERRTLAAGGAERTYWMAPQPAPGAPLLVVLHGMGLNGPQMAAWTGLAVRGPAAGFATVFPDAVGEVWDDIGHGRLDGIDDGRFIAGLIDRLVAEGNARAGVVFLAGLSNGAFFVERLARHGIVRATGLILVAGTSRQAARQAAPRPARPAAVLCIEGTRDPMVPNNGGRASGILSWMSRRRARRYLVHADGREVVAVETLTGDWAAANGCSPVPAADPVPGEPGDLRVSRQSWTAAGRSPVVLYWIEGGGHGWPGGPQYMPALFVGRIARQVDATGILLDFARDVVRTNEASSSVTT